MKRRWVWTLLVGLGIAAVLSPFASSLPDGLEWAAEKAGISTESRDDAAQPGTAAPLADYTVPGVSSPALGSSLSGVLGALLVFVVLLGLGALLTRRKATHTSRAAPDGSPADTTSNPETADDAGTG
ncbi:PDGLE domain-containing protein [bacterium]|nr:PDGLE domain-containing protein [bacterium]